MMNRTLYTTTCYFGNVPRTKNKLLLFLFLCLGILISPTLKGQVFSEIIAFDNTLATANADNMAYAVAIDGDYAVVGVKGSDIPGLSRGIVYVLNKDQGGTDNWGVVATLSASDGLDNDQFGAAVAISGDYVVIGAPFADPVFTANGKAYVFYRNQGGPDNWGEQAILTHADATTSADNFGHDVAISGTNIVVGAKNNDFAASGAGTAYVFEKDFGGIDNWGQRKRLNASDAASLDKFGDAVSINGSFIAIGTPGDDDLGGTSGSIYIFEQNRGGVNNWGELVKRTASDGALNDNFGHDLAIKGDYLVVGAPFASPGGVASAGKAYVFERNHGGIDNWGERQILLASDGLASHSFGYAVDLDGTRAVVGAYRCGISVPASSEEGAVYVFEKDFGGVDTWGEEEKEATSNGAAIDRFGSAVALSGQYLIGGAYNRDFGGFTDAGAYYIFKEAGGPTLDEIAITEWMCNPSGTEAEGEWVELYNYGASTVNLRDWRLKDEDSDDAVISSTDLFLPAGEYLILARNKAKFEEHWLKGCVSNKVVQVGLILTNSTDEIILEDASANVIWSVAYANDDTEGRATFDTEGTFGTRVFGSKASPGVDRNGNDVTGTLGYEKNNVTTDPNAFVNSIGDIGSPMYTSLADRVRGNALLFDGVDDHIDMGATTGIENIAAFTFETWINPITIDAVTERIFSKRNGNTERIEITLGNNGANDFLRVFICNGTSEVANIPTGIVPIGVWTHIAVAFDGSQALGSRLKVYVNGIEHAADLDPSATLTPSGNGVAHLGKRSDNANKPSNIQLDEVRLWTVARTAREIRENMHLTLTGCETGLNTYYQLNETSGTVAVDVMDANHGTLVNAPTRLASDVNVGNSSTAISESITGVTTGLQNFSTANVAMEFTSHSGAEDVTVTYQSFSPNNTAAVMGTNIIQNPMWTINTSTTTETYVADITFTFPVGTYTNLDPLKYGLYWRPMYSGGDWQKVDKPSAITATTATFSNISLRGQFMMVQESDDLVTDVRGNMYSFDGVDDGIAVVDHPSLDMGTGDFTLEAWIKTTSGANGRIVTKGGGGTPLYQLLTNGGGSASFFIRNTSSGSSVTTSTTLINDGVWHHVAGVKRGANMEIYIDGVLETTVAEPGGTSDNNLDLVIGRFRSDIVSLPFSGSMDEIRIWNVARSQTELRANMHLTLRGNETGLVSYYQFNTDDVVGTANGVKDATGTNNGTTLTMAASAYLESEVAVAGGTSDIMTIAGAGVYNFPNTDIDIEFDALNPNGEIVVYRLETEKPHGWASIGFDVDDEYFVVENFGTNTVFDPLIDMTFNRLNYINPTDVGMAQISSPLHMYKRGDSDYGATWGASKGGADNGVAGSNGAVGYNVNNNITSFSQIVVANTNQTLPVELVSFDAKRLDADKVELQWATASETNNQGFYIERMLENEISFSEVGWVNGNGTVVGMRYYQSEDINSYIGMSYYRLRQVDFDGTTTYSEIRAVDGISSGKYLDVSVYPNPVEKKLQIALKQLPKGISYGQVKILTADGKVLHQFGTTLQSNQIINVDFVGQLHPGVYMLVIEAGEEDLIVQKFIKS